MTVVAPGTSSALRPPCPHCKGRIEIVCMGRAKVEVARCTTCGRDAADQPPPKPRTSRIYQPKRCGRCGGEFAPTGPRALYCQKCKGIGA